jgi:hypothetical protein
MPAETIRSCDIPHLHPAFKTIAFIWNSHEIVDRKLFVEG